MSPNSIAEMVVLSLLEVIPNGEVKYFLYQTSESPESLERYMGAHGIEAKHVFYGENVIITIKVDGVVAHTKGFKL